MYKAYRITLFEILSNGSEIYHDHYDVYTNDSLESLQAKKQVEHESYSIKIEEVMKIEYSREAKKNIEKHDKPTRMRLKKAIENIPKGDIIKLQGYKDDFRLRVGDLRVIFTISNDTVIIKDVLPRGKAYKR